MMALKLIERFIPVKYILPVFKNKSVVRIFSNKWINTYTSVKFNEMCIKTNEKLKLFLSDMKLGVRNALLR